MSSVETDNIILKGSEDDEDDDEELLAQFLEAEVLAEDVYESTQDLNQEDLTSGPSKRVCLGKEWKREVVATECAENIDFAEKRQNAGALRNYCGYLIPKHCTQNCHFSTVPSELYPNIFKFLSPADLVNCSLVCKFMRIAASDESLWHRLYHMRWGFPETDNGKLQLCSWKNLYIEQDSADMNDFVRDSPIEFQKYYIQIQAAKRSEAPSPTKLEEDLTLAVTTVDDQISQWKQSCGLPDVFTGDHVCSGSTCTYSQVGNFFLCENTGCVHVCDHTCQETVYDTSNQLLVCTISGRCSQQWISTSEEEVDPGHHQDDIAASDEAEPLTTAAQLTRAYLLGYNCNDEEELELALREVIYPGSNKI
ncbi:hypothetical protein SUGI_0899990 [Cryptomeria japonica]|uniref:F-box protein SKIP31 n=1 Tax=Cryptomeria japonica TaxID=3369 RepID=UPI0024146B19|nr:F-box protein SKIP31 [Cryptomeria japonica]GLJ43330.1 hypothetical protein SUGI_0899990 [Cryptomeria japonica]